MKGKLTAIILAAAIGVPTISAVAAFTGDTPSTDAATDSAAAPEQSDGTTFAIQDAVARDADLQRACGEDGPALAGEEAAGTITPLEQAALDALRPICADTENPLPVASVTDRPAQIVTVVETVSAAPAPAHETENEDEREDEREDD
ncbi:MAG TPA: hypothetical protein ENH00_02870 [Actinobacteria bacterium]|nr:hypothetical protein BMS3Bbin01_00227 [bacterium BMS3Bbin01]HDH25123.1 hypothetical protein [Actinomycetota bacterium]